MFGLRQLILVVVVCAATSSSSNGVFALSPAARTLRVQHDGPHAPDGSPLPNPATTTVAGDATSLGTTAQLPVAPASMPSMPGTVTASKPAKVKNPGGLLGSLYAAFPTLMKPIALISDTIHNSNAAMTGVQHTPDGIFQA